MLDKLPTDISIMKNASASIRGNLEIMDTLFKENLELNDLYVFYQMLMVHFYVLEEQIRKHRGFAEEFPKYANCE